MFCRSAAQIAFCLLISFVYSVVVHAEGGSRYIVRLKPVASAASVLETYSHLPIKNRYTALFSGFSATLSDEDLSTMRKDESIEEITVDQEVWLDQHNVQNEATWGLSRIDQRASSPDNYYDYSFTGDGVTVYVVDTGINIQHREFQGRASIAASFIPTSKGDGGDCHGHGSHVAGIIGGKQFGVAKHVKLVGLRALNCEGRGSMGDILEALDWVAANGKYRSVVNISIGTGASKELDRAISQLVGRGVTVVVSAGNSAQDACLQSPARAKEAITVGAVGRGDVRAVYSNDGPCVDIFAPGNEILSAHKGDRSSTKVLSGTSMATPFVSGVIALALEQYPKLSTADVRKLVLESATRGVVTEATTSNNHLIFSLFGSN